MIRPYTAQDREAILAIFRENVPEHFDPQEEKDLVKFLDGQPAYYYVYLENGEIAGCCGYDVREADRTGIIAWSFLTPKYQRRGAGTLLVQHCLNELYDLHGVRHFEVRTSQLAWKFYKRFGFGVVSTKKDYWGKGFDLYAMEMDKKDVL